MAKIKVVKEETAAEKKRHYSMKIVTQVGSIDHIDWGWSSHESRVTLERRFHIFDGIIAVLAFIQFILVSYGAAFDPFDVGVLGVCYTLDFFFALDIVASVVKCYTMDIRNVEFRKGNSNLDKFLKGLFILDILGLIPMDIIPILVCSKSAGLSTYQACSMPKLGYVRINRLISGYKIFRFLIKMEEKVGAYFTVIRGLSYAALTVMLVHGAACIWYLIPCSDFSHVGSSGIIHVYCTGPSWIFSGGSTYTPDPYTNNSESDYRHGLPGFPAYNKSLVPRPNTNLYAGIFDHGQGSSAYLLSLAAGVDYVRVNATLGQRYLYSLYWSVMTITTVGLGDVHAITISEMIFAIITQLVGMIVLFGIVQGSITSMLTNFDAILFQYKHRIFAILDYLRDQNQSTELVGHVLDFYNYLWKRSSGMSSAGLFDDLPFALRSEIAMELCGQIIDRSPLFQDLNASFLRMLSVKFNPMLALPEQIIMRKGELSDMMVFIQRGELEVLSDDENEVPVLLLRPGKLFGEINLITRMPRRYSVRAIAHCDLVVLRTEDLMECLAAFPEIADELRQRAEERTGIIQTRTQDGLLDNQEIIKRKKQQKELCAKMEELQYEIGVNIRPLMTALNIARPQETLKVSDSMELFKIRDPMDEMVEYNMGSAKEQFNSRFRRMRQTFYDLSVDPDGLFYYFWERILICMVIVTFFLNTYVGFFQSYRTLLQVPDCGNTTEGVNVSARIGGIFLIIIDYLMDIFFIVDYALKFVTQIKTANGKVTDHSLVLFLAVERLQNEAILFDRSMALAYLRSWGCYTDFLAVFPIEIFAVAGAAQGTCVTPSILNLLGYLKVNRALRVLTLPEFFDYLASDLSNPITSVRILKFILYISMMTQTCAVALYMTACDSESCDDNPVYAWTGARPEPWMLKQPDPNNTNGVNGTMGYRYSTTFYYSVKLMTTVGYGELYPHNIGEQVVVILVMLAGVLTYGYCLSVLTATIANLDAPRVDFQTRLFGLIKYMESNKLAQVIQQRAIESVALLWTVSKGEEIPGVKSMIADMPEHLMEDIQVDDLVHLVAGVPIFQNVEEQILKLLAPAVRRYIFPPDEYIIQSGDLIPELFVIRRGFCHLFHPEQSSVVIAVLHPGMYFGEIGFLFNHNEIVTIKTITHCEVLTLPRAAFDHVAVHIHWLYHQIEHISVERQYYEDMVHVARGAKAHVKKRKQASPTRMSEKEKRKLRFRDDLNAVQVSSLRRFFARALSVNTIPMDSRFLWYWEWTRLGASVLQFMLLMIQVAFQLQDWRFYGPLYIFDFHAVADIYLKFHAQYINDMHVTVTHPLMTAKRYLNSNFLLDLFSVIPFEVFLLIPVAGDVSSPGRTEVLHWFMYVRLNRLFQIYRVPLAFNYLESNIKVKPASLFLAKYLTYFVIYITFVACLPLTIQCPPLACALSNQSCYFPYPNATQTDLGIALDIDFAEYPELSSPDQPLHRTKRDVSSSTNLTYGIVDSSGNVNIDNSSLCVDWSYLSDIGINDTTDAFTQFVATFYWAVTTTTTTGFGDMYANNQVEQVVFSIIMISGVLFYGYIVACVAAAQTNDDARRSRFYERVATIKKYMRQEHLPKQLQKRVARFYEYLWLRTEGIDQQHLITGLPPSLTGELALQLYRKVIDQIPIFKNTPLGFKKMVAAIIRPLYVIEGEYVTRIGDIGSDLFFLYRGSVEVQYRTGDFSPTIIRSGRILGEMAFLTNQKAKSSYRARENSDLYYLTKTEFEVVLDHFPEVRDKLMEEARETMELEAEHHRVFESKPHRQGDKNSVSFHPRVKMAFKERVGQWGERVFSPSELFIRYGHLFGVTGVRICSVMIIMYQAGFANVDLKFYPINYFLHFIAFLDTFLTLRVSFLDEYGNDVLDKARIKERYLKSYTGLAVDVLALFPFEIFSLAAPSAQRGTVWAYLRIFRLPAHLFRIREFFLNWLAELNINILNVRLLYSFVQLAIWMHFFTCVGYYLGDCPTCGSGKATSWMKNTVLANDDEPYSAKYVVTLYWIVNTVTTTGYGDIIPLTNTGRIFCMIIQVVGKCIIGFIIGSISSALVNTQIARQNFEGQFQTMKHYLIDQQANEALVERVRNHFTFLWHVGRGIHDVKNILTDAPFCLRTEISFAVHHRDLRQLSIFRDSSDSFIRMLSACLHQVQFVPGDYIIQQGDLVQELYLLHRGEAVEIETGVEIGVIRHGSHINWQAILIDWPASRTVRATDNCEVYVLSRSDLNAVVDKFKHEMEQICNTTRMRLRDLLEEENVELD